MARAFPPAPDSTLRAEIPEVGIEDLPPRLKDLGYSADSRRQTPHVDRTQKLGHARRLFYVPGAITEVPLIRGYERGMVALTKAGDIQPPFSPTKTTAPLVFLW